MNPLENNPRATIAFLTCNIPTTTCTTIPTPNQNQIQMLLKENFKVRFENVLIR